MYVFSCVDKNPDRMEEATKQFQMIGRAWEVENGKYGSDDRFSQILKSVRGMTSTVIRSMGMFYWCCDEM